MIQLTLKNTCNEKAKLETRILLKTIFNEMRKL